MLEEILTDHDFWAEAKARFIRTMRPRMEAIFLEGVRVSRTFDVPEYTSEKDFLDPPDDLLDDAAGRIFANYLDGWWAGLEATTRDGLRRALQRAAETGGGSRQVIRDLQPLFGRSRARIIGVTETTRLFGLGAQASYRASGLETWTWRTVTDNRVCTICAGLAGDSFSIDVDFNPAHPGCRCFPSPGRVRRRRGRKEWEAVGRMVDAVRRRIAA